MYSWLCSTLLNIFILFIIQTLHYSDFFVGFVFVCPDNRGWTVFPVIYVKLPHSREVSFLISPQWCKAKRRSLLLDGSLFPCTSSETCSMKARNIMFSLMATDIGVFTRLITGNVFFKIEIKKNLKSSIPSLLPWRHACALLTRRQLCKEWMESLSNQ